MSMVERKAVELAETAPLDGLVVPAAEAAAYIERMCSELAGLADRGGLGFLAYLLEVAREEAVLHCDTPQSSTRVLHGELPPG